MFEIGWERILSSCPCSTRRGERAGTVLKEGFDSSLFDCLIHNRVTCINQVSVTQLCPTPGPTDCSPPGSSVHGILQARTLGWVAISPPGESSPPRDQTQVSCVSRTTGVFFTA